MSRSCSKSMQEMPTLACAIYAGHWTVLGATQTLHVRMLVCRLAVALIGSLLTHAKSLCFMRRPAQQC